LACEKEETVIGKNGFSNCTGCRVWVYQRIMLLGGGGGGVGGKSGSAIEGWGGGGVKSVYPNPTPLAHLLS
jgi:hypothetical protein